MGDLVGRLIGYALLIGGIAAVIGGGIMYLENKGYARAEAKYKPQLEHCDKVLQEAKSANAQLASDVLQIKAKYLEQNKSIAELEKAQAEATAAKNQALAKLAAREIELRKQINHYAALAAGPPAPTRQESCDEADRILAELAAHRLRND